jgi:AraC family transcriptional regulator
MKDDTRRHYEQLVVGAIDHLRSTLDEALDIVELGRRACLSPLHFHRIFRGLAGETPAELHRRLRLERAAYRLATSDQPVTRLAFEAGYATHESFTRAFAAAYGVSPSDLRGRTRENPTSWAAATASALATPSGVHFTAERGLAPIRLTTEHIDMKVSVEFLPAKRVLAVAHRGPYGNIGAAFARLDAVLSNTSRDDLGCVEMVALYHDDPESVPAAELRADAGVVVSDHASVPSELHVVTIPAGVYARTLHQGPYERLGDAWARFMGGWLVQSGHRVGDGPMYERYLNTPMDAAPHELRTELLLCLADSAAHLASGIPPGAAFSQGSTGW